MADAKAASPGRVDAAAVLCPKCSCPDLRRSRVRFYEKPRKWLTTSRPYRCGGCLARVWGPIEIGAVAVNQRSEPLASTSLDLSDIDRSLERH